MTISGDFTFEPAPLLGKLEGAWRGCPLVTRELTSVIADFFATGEVQAQGGEPADITRVLLKLRGDAAE